MSAASPKLVIGFDPPEAALALVRRSAPGINVVVAAEPSAIFHEIRDADAACVDSLDPRVLSTARRLRWIHALMGGVESILSPQLRGSDITVTCCKECFAVPAAEYALAVMLAFTRRLEYDIRMRAGKRFIYQEPEELSGKTAAVIGMGNIGREVTKRCHCFGMRVIGVSRTARSAAFPADCVVTRDQLSRVLQESDYALVCVPLTAETTGLIGEHEISQMRSSAYLIDVSGRPALYDLHALEAALRSRRLAGANLQYVPQDDSSLWSLDNLLLAFHRTTSRQEITRCYELLAINAARFQNGEPLSGTVDKKAGY